MSQDGWDPGPPPSRTVDLGDLAESRELRREAAQLVKQIVDAGYPLDAWQAKFVGDIEERLAAAGWMPTRKQVFKLRDIAEIFG
jgi:hypothetical protein